MAHIYGTSFPERDVFDNLTLQFERQQDSGFAVAVLHANVGGHPDHDPYAPCAVDDLVARGALVRPIPTALSKGGAVYLVVPNAAKLVPVAQRFHDWILAEAAAQAVATA